MSGRNSEELEDIASTLFGFCEERDGVLILGTEWDAEKGVVTLMAVTADPNALRVALADTYEEVVQLDWAGADEYIPRPACFAGWTIADDDRTLTVSWLGGVAEPLPLEFRETPDAVEVLLQELVYVGASVAVGIERQQTGVLPSPLAGRIIVDATPRDPNRIYGDE